MAARERETRAIRSRASFIPARAKDWTHAIILSRLVPDLPETCVTELAEYKRSTSAVVSKIHFGGPSPSEGRSFGTGIAQR